MVENSTSERRTAAIKIYSGNLSETVTVTQQPSASVQTTHVLHVPQKGDLAKILNESGVNPQNIVSLKITGVLNDEDFLTIRDMPNLKSIDISEVNITALPTKAFCNLTTTENVILPNTLTKIGFVFSDCRSLTSVKIPASVEKSKQRHSGMFPISDRDVRERLTTENDWR